MCGPSLHSKIAPEMRVPLLAPARTQTCLRQGLGRGGQGRGHLFVPTRLGHRAVGTRTFAKAGVARPIKEDFDPREGGRPWELCGVRGWGPQAQASDGACETGRASAMRDGRGAAPAPGGSVLRSQGPDAAGLWGNRGGRPHAPLAERKSETRASPGPGSRATVWRSLPAPLGRVPGRQLSRVLLAAPVGLGSGCRGAGFQADGAKGFLDKLELPQANWDGIPAGLPRRLAAACWPPCPGRGRRRTLGAGSGPRHTRAT